MAENPNKPSLGLNRVHALAESGVILSDDPLMFASLADAVGLAEQLGLLAGTKAFVTVAYPLAVGASSGTIDISAWTIGVPDVVAVLEISKDGAGDVNLRGAIVQTSVTATAADYELNAAVDVPDRKLVILIAPNDATLTADGAVMSHTIASTADLVTVNYAALALAGAPSQVIALSVAKGAVGDPNIYASYVDGTATSTTAQFSLNSAPTVGRKLHYLIKS